jgi:hypothetical protein
MSTDGKKVSTDFTFPTTALSGFAARRCALVYLHRREEEFNQKAVEFGIRWLGCWCWENGSWPKYTQHLVPAALKLNRKATRIVAQAGACKWQDSAEHAQL